MSRLNSTEAEAFFYGFKNHFMDLGLDNMKEFMAALGNPQNQVKVIHIAGTNGKGSVSAFLANILTEAGYKTGRYNSPVVSEKLENITVNGEKMTGEEFADQVNLMRPVIEAADKKGKLPTIFELETALAYQYFAYSHCDFAVIECGMGGEKDATNVTEATVLSIFTSISMDHMSYLGATLQEIAKSKAGIIRQGIPALVIEQKEEVMKSMMGAASLHNARLITVKKDSIQMIKSGLEEQVFRYRCNSGTEREYNLQMPGIYQTENAAEAVEAVSELIRQGYEIGEEAIKKGLFQTVLPGRFEVIKRQNPMIIIDGAHNPGAAVRLRENIRSLLDGYNIIFIMGIFRDKDYKKVVENTCSLADNIYVVKADSPRALEADKLAGCIADYGKTACPVGNIDTALEMAVLNAKQLKAENGKKSAVICFGSLSYLRHIREAVNRENREQELENQDEDK